MTGHGDGDHQQEPLPLKSKEGKGRWVGTARVCRNELQSGASLQREEEEPKSSVPEATTHKKGRQGAQSTESTTRCVCTLPQSRKAAHAVCAPCHKHAGLHASPCTATHQGTHRAQTDWLGVQRGAVSPQVPPSSPYLSILLRLCLLRSL